MDFYTGKPDRPVEHYGVVHHTFQTSHATGIAKAFPNVFFDKSGIAQQSDEEALQAIEQLVVERKSMANVIYNINISIAHIPGNNSYCILTKIYASYGRFIG